MEAKIPALIGNEQVADGKVRRAGRICRLFPATLATLSASGRARPATAEEIEKFGIDPDPETDPGQQVRDMGESTPAMAAADAEKKARQRREAEAAAEAAAESAAEDDHEGA